MSQTAIRPDVPSRSPQRARSKERGGAGVLQLRFFGIVVFLAALIVIFSLLSPRFFTFGNATSILYSAAILTIAAAAQSLVLITGNLDLSVGSIMGLVAYVVFDLTSVNPVLQALALPIALLVGALLGAFNGLLVAVLGIPSIVATLGTLSVYRGIVSFYASAQDVTSGQLPTWARELAKGIWLGLPAYVWVAVVVVGALTLALKWLPWGRMLYAYGSNPKAAQFFGLPSRRIVVGAYIGAGAIAAVAGLLLGAQVGTINSLLASGAEMEVLAAAVIGGVSIWGGSGSVVGAAVGAVVLATINNGLVQVGVQEFYRLLIQGVAIVLAVGIDAIVQRRISAVGSRRRTLEVGE